MFLWDLYLLVVYRPPYSYNEEKNAALIQFFLDCCVDKNILVVWILIYLILSLRWDESGDISESYNTPLDRSFYESFLMA